MFSHIFKFLFPLLFLSSFHHVTSTQMRWAKDAGTAPTFQSESDGTVTAVYPIMEGPVDEIEPYRRQLQTALTQSELNLKMLDKHNALRAQTANGLAPCSCGSLCGSGHKGSGYHPGATNMNELFWDEALQRTAQNYADKCLFIHNSGRSAEAFQLRSYAIWKQTKEKYMGENLYISSTSGKYWNNIFGDKDYGIEGGLQGWFDECVDFYLKEGGSCGSSVGHYTQMVRADTRLVGCGVSICPSGVKTESSSYSWAQLNVVCNYGGGQYSDMPYKVAYSAGEVASQCEPDRIANHRYQGLCGGPQAKDYFENAQSSYDKSSYPLTSNDAWICDNGVGFNTCSGASSGTPRPTPYPTGKPTAPPTTTTTPRPTARPTATKAPTTSPVTPIPTETRVTAQPPPTTTTARPTQYPTNRVTQQPTKFPTDTPRPTAAPVVSTGCESSKCTFSIHADWKSESWEYRGFADAVWQTLKNVLDLENENNWSASYSWGGRYKRVNGNYVLFVYDDLTLTWDQLSCTKKAEVIAILGSTQFETDMKAGIMSIMGSVGEIPDDSDYCGICSSNSCATTSAAAFGAVDDEGNVELPFSTWNLNSYDFSDWFVLLFILFTGCVCCFGCGWYMHRRRVFKAMDDATINEYTADQQMVDIVNDGDDMMTGSNTKKQKQRQKQKHQTDMHEMNLQKSGSTEPEIEIGVSVKNNGTIIQDESDDEN